MNANTMGTLSASTRFVAPHMQQQMLHHQHHVQQHGIQQHGVQQHVQQHAQPQPQHQVQQQQQPPGTAGGIVNPSWARSPHGATSAATAGAISGPAANGQAPPVVVRRMKSQGSAASLPGLPPFAQPQDPRPALGAIPVPMTTQVTAMTTPTTTPRIPGHRPPTSEIHVEAGTARAPPGEEALYREVDALRHTLAMQEQRISDLNMELQASREAGTQLAFEVDSGRSELSSLIQELHMERAARERAETVMAEQQQAMLTLPAGRRGSRDEVEPRLREFVEKSKCNLIFRQLNRGWYAFRRADDKGPQTNDRHVAISIINSKLMVTLEPSTHDPGWNFGKPGPIEKFVAKHFEE